jgi:glycosyltransferase involved in cell wall biosynthesis
MRVLHLINEMGVGGAESVTVELVRRGADVGWTSAVASSGGYRAEQLACEGIELFEIPLAKRSIRGVLRARAAARRAIRGFRPDIVVAHGVSATVVGRLSSVRIPLVTVFHGVADADYRASAVILTVIGGPVVTVAQAIADRLHRSGLRRAHTVVIRNAVTTGAASTADRTAARRTLGLDDHVPVALCLARMEPQKRHDVLLDGWANLDYGRLLLAGDGSRRSRLMQRAEPLGDRVQFLGNRDDVPLLLAATDITVLTSDWEGLPIAVLESLAAGRPVVACDVDGVREVLGHGGGRLVPAGDVRAVALAMDELLSDERTRRLEAERGLATLQSRFAPTDMLRAYDELFRMTLKVDGVSL